jgi:hypothetical protein
MGVEASNWYLTQRAMQNAADTAAIAAATNNSGATNSNGCTVVGDFCNEAKAAAASYGYTDGTSNVTVTPTYMTSGCPGSLSECYKVTIVKNIPLELLQAVGYNGTASVTVSGAHAQQLVAVSIARPKIPVDYCSIALGAGNSFTIDGGPNVNLAGCDLFSDGNLKCNGANSDTGVPFGEAVGTSKCGATQVSGQPKLSDPFSALSSKIPTLAGCSSPSQTNPTIITTAPTSNLQICGPAKLGNNINITTSKIELIVYDGSLDLAGHTLSTSGNGSVTIIFGTSGTDNATAQYPVDSVGGGTIDIAAPGSGSGPFSGVAIMQDNTITDSGSRLDLTLKGNQNTNYNLKIQGLIYFPNGNFDIAGAIDLHTGGLSCIGIIAQTILVNGTGSIFANDPQGDTAGCPAAGLTLPTVPNSGANLALVQ